MSLCGSVHSTQAPHLFLEEIRHLQGHEVFSNSMGCDIFFSETISLRLGSKTTDPASKTAADRVLPAPKTPLIAKPVRLHKANTIALNVASTCPSSRRRSGRMAACKATCAAFSQQTVSIPMANHKSLKAA